LGAKMTTLISLSAFSARAENAKKAKAGIRKYLFTCFS